MIYDIKYDGWTMVQKADRKEHTLEINVFAKDGTVTELRIRHNDGEEEVLKGKLNDRYSLPMPVDAIKEAFKSGELTFKSK